MAADIPAPVRRLILEAIDSVPELEALLLLRETRDTSWTPEAASARLYVSPTVGAYTLRVLTARGFRAAGRCKGAGDRALELYALGGCAARASDDGGADGR